MQQLTIIDPSALRAREITALNNARRNQRRKYADERFHSSALENGNRIHEDIVLHVMAKVGYLFQR